MSEYYDDLETRGSDERAAAQLQALRAQLHHARQNTTAYAGLLKDIDIDSITDFDAFTSVPITRKSELITCRASSALSAATRPATVRSCRTSSRHPAPSTSPVSRLPISGALRVRSTPAAFAGAIWYTIVSAITSRPPG